MTMGYRRRFKFARSRLFAVSFSVNLEDSCLLCFALCSSIVVDCVGFDGFFLRVSAQPPGIPEICKKSLTACPASGGLELFVLGKNFLKDTRVYFQQVDDDRNIRWEQSVLPDKEFLQQVNQSRLKYKELLFDLLFFFIHFQTHFVCVVPPFVRPDITEPVTVRLYVVSSGKMSEPHQFVFTPVNGAMPSGKFMVYYFSAV